jgi:DNA-binding response OmpR family regulator
MENDGVLPPPVAAPERSTTGPWARPLRAAVIDADPHIALALAERVTGQGRSVQIFHDPPSLDELEAARPNVILVDLALLEARAWDFLRDIRVRLGDIGLVVHTAASTPAQRVCGLTLGADDWVDRPCDPDELLARVESAARRRTNASTPAEHDLDGNAANRRLAFGELELRADQLQAFVGRRSVDLTPREFGVLHALATRRGEVVDRDEVYEMVWGQAMPTGDRAVDVFIRKVRTKLERACPGQAFIHTHHGVGYRFEPEPTASPVLGLPGRARAAG